MKNKGGILTLTLRLAVITVCAGLILGLVYGVTKNPIAQQESLKETRARQTVLPAAADFEQVDLAALGADGGAYGIVNDVYRGTADGQTAGYAMSLTTKGYSPGLNLTVGMDQNGVITGVAIGSHSETPGLGANAANPGFLAQYAGADGPLTVVKAAAGGAGEIAAITGATITSTAVTDAVNLVKEFYVQYLREGV